MKHFYLLAALLICCVSQSYATLSEGETELKVRGARLDAHQVELEKVARRFDRAKTDEERAAYLQELMDLRCGAHRVFHPKIYDHGDISSPHIQALRIIDAQLADATTPEEKEAILARRMNGTYLQDSFDYKRKDHTNQIIEEELLYGRRGNKTNALGLAILTLDLGRLEEYLPLIRNINDSCWRVRGYRQSYSPAHQVLDTYSHSGGGYYYDLEKKIQAIDFLAQYEVDWNWRPDTPMYNNPPLNAGENSGHIPSFGGDLWTIKMRAVLYGADPTISSSSYGAFATENNIVEIMSDGSELGRYTFEDRRYSLVEMDQDGQLMSECDRKSRERQSKRFSLESDPLFERRNKIKNKKETSIWERWELPRIEKDLKNLEKRVDLFWKEYDKYSRSISRIFVEQYYDMLSKDIPINYTPWVVSLLESEGIEGPSFEDVLELEELPSSKRTGEFKIFGLGDPSGVNVGVDCSIM